MPPQTGNFKAQLGHAGNPGLLSPQERLARIQPGQNPFVTGTSLPANSPVFFGRAQVLHETLSVLRRPDKPGCVSLLGERRIGKSSVLNQIRAALAQEAGLVSVYASVQDWNQGSQQNFFTCLQRVVSDVVRETPQNEVNDYAGFRDFIYFLVQNHNYRFVLILDEFDVMAGNPNFDTYFFSNMRALGERPEYRFGYLVASRRPLKTLCQEHKIEASSFWNIFGFKHVLGLLTEREAGDLVKIPLNSSLSSTECRSAEQLWQNDIKRFAGCHPALIQMIAFKYWESWKHGLEPDPPDITMGVRDYLEDLWNRCNPEEREVLSHAVKRHRPVPGPLVTGLIQRGLLASDSRPFSDFFATVIAECSSRKLKITWDSFNGLLDRALILIEKAGKAWRRIKNVGGDDK